MKTKLTIGHFPIVDHLILGVAQEHDGRYFKHLELKPKLFVNWNQMSEALRTGELDGTFMPAPLAMELIRTGVPAKIVLLGQREGQVFVVQHDIKSYEMLKGKTILVPTVFSMGNILLHRVLRSVGLDPEKDITLQPNFDSARDIPMWLRENKIQASMTAEPWGMLGIENGAGYLMAVGQSLQMHHLCCLLVMRTEVIERAPEAVHELIESLVKAGMFINAYPHQSAEIGSRFMEISEKLALKSITHHNGHVLFWDLMPRVEDFEEIQDALINELHVWDKPVDVTAMVDNTFAQHAYRTWMLDTRREVKDKGAERTLPGNFKEAAGRFLERIPDAVIHGLKYVKAGQRYPKADKEKGFVTFSPDSMKEPDLVIIKLSEHDAMRCMAALGFGKHAHADILTPRDDGTYEIEYQAFKFLVLLLAYY